jgi:TIR domain
MKKKILVIASNPQGTASLRLDKELRVINDVIQRSRLRDQFDVQSLWATRTIDLLPALLQYKPWIVHFCGHGEGSVGLVLEDEVGRVKLVSSEALAGLFMHLASDIECVLLNACYSQDQANAIVQQINYVIGMSREIRDDAAIAFTRGFYTALGNGELIKKSYDLGKSQIAIEISSDSTVTVDSRKLMPVERSSVAEIASEHSIPLLFERTPLIGLADDKISMSAIPQAEPVSSTEFLYDAYICYVDQEPDSTWVWDTLVPKLEQAGLKIAVSGETDIPGVSLVKNIEQGIQQSKRTVIVLSDAYLADNMAEFENTLGQTMGIQEGTYRLLPVKAMPLDTSHLPTRLSMLTTLDLAHPRRADREFTRLIEALRHPLPRM